MIDNLAHDSEDVILATSSNASWLGRPMHDSNDGVVDDVFVVQTQRQRATVWQLNEDDEATCWTLQEPQTEKVRKSSSNLLSKRRLSKQETRKKTLAVS